MMSGFSMFSFDLFGLFRCFDTSRANSTELDLAKVEKGTISFFGMFPVL